MASDGLLINFEVNDEPINLKPVVKGGHWKQRRAINKRFRDGHKTSHGNPKTSKDDENEPLKKKPRRESDQNSPETSTRRAVARPREVISSLFTFNPVPVALDGKAEDKAEQTVAPSNAPLPTMAGSFQALGLSPTLAVHLLTKLEVKDPTAVQKASIPQLLKDDSDAFIQAQTGSGKTLAYLLPLVEKLMQISSTTHPAGSDSAQRINRDSGLFAIILAPTRELAKQISVVLEKLLRCAHWLVAGTVLGGEKKKSEKARLRKGLNILVATPGRLVDHLAHTDVLNVSKVRWLILDEGDRLMELGFEQDIKAIMDRLEAGFEAPSEGWLSLPARRTTILCSATMKTNVQRLGEISLKDAIHIRTDTVEAQPRQGGAQNVAAGAETRFSAPAQLKQSYILVPPKQRLVTLHALLRHTFARKGSVMKVIVFLSCADSVEYHFSVLTRTEATQEEEGSSTTPKQTSVGEQQISAAAPTLTSLLNPGLKIFKLHGSLAQPIRTATLNAFSQATEPSIMLCTDVASRGLDLPSVDLVIEYDPAFSAEDHLHRIGRTARAGRDGRAMIFLMPGPEESYVEILRDSYTDTPGAKVSRQDAAEVMKRGFSLAANGAARDGPVSKRAWEDAATEYQLDVERWLTSDSRVHEVARKAYISHVRAYATHIVPERHIFDIKDLHLGHLAKAFGLREQPTNMGRSKSGGGQKAKTARREGPRASKGADLDGTAAAVDQDEAARKMRRAMKLHMSAASEFNIG